MARSLTNAERQLISAMISSAQTTNPTVEETAATGQQWRSELREMLDRISVGDACDCGKCPSVQLLVDEQPVPAGKNQIILEAFLSDGIVMLFVDDGKPSYLEVAPNLDVELELPDEKTLIF